MRAKPIRWTTELEARLCEALGVKKWGLGAALASFFGVGQSAITPWKHKDSGIPRGRLHELANRRNLSFEWLAFGREPGPAGVSEPHRPLAGKTSSNWARRVEDQDPRATELVKRIRDMVECGAHDELGALLTMATAALAGRGGAASNKQRRSR